MTHKNKQTTPEDLERAIKNPEALYQELNLLKVEGAAFAFDPKDSGKGGTYEILEYVRNPEEKIKERPIVIEPHQQYGRPSPLAYKLLNTLFKKLSEYGIAVPNSVPFTFRELAERVGRVSWGGKDGAEIYLALKQIQTTNITCWGYDKSSKRWTNVSFNIFTSVLSSGTKGRFSEGYVAINPLIVGNLQRSYHRSMNYTRMSSLDPISIALYKQIYNVFSTRKSHKQLPAFEKNYTHICREWLGGLKEQKHRSLILQHLGPHLDRLKDVKLLRSYQIERNSTSEWKFRFIPGNGFHEDYENFFQKSNQNTLRFSYHTDKQNIQDPIELVWYFYTRLYNTSDANNLSVCSPKETEFARTILSSMTLQEAKNFVDFSLAQAATTSFDIKAFMGIRQYLPAWPGAMKEFEERRFKEQQRERKQKQEELENLYHTFRQSEIKKVREHLSPHELSDIEKQTKDHLLQENPNMFGLPTMVRIKTDSILAERFRIPSFEEWEKELGEEQRTDSLKNSMGGLT
jgi:hypothetical protein